MEKYNAIYAHLRKALENGEFLYALPPEGQLARQYGCSRNTVRRAVGRLADDGYVQSVRGKGVMILRRGQEQAEFFISRIESMKEAAARNHRELKTKVVYFTELVVDNAARCLTGFPEGEEIYYIQRVRYLNGEALILDHNYFLRSIVKGLSPKIAEGSIYDYMEGVLKERIITSQRKYTVERVDELDRRYLDLKDCNCLAVVTSRTFNQAGIQFEYTQSRHHPDNFVFYGQVRGRK